VEIQGEGKDFEENYGKSKGKKCVRNKYSLARRVEMAACSVVRKRVVGLVLFRGRRFKWGGHQRNRGKKNGGFEKTGELEKATSLNQRI